MELRTVIICVIDTIIFFIIRGIYVFSDWGSNQAKILWLICLLLISAINILIFFLVKKRYVQVGYKNVIIGFILGIVIAVIISLVLNKYAPYLFLLTNKYLYGLYLLDAIDRGNIAYSLRILFYISIYDLIGYIIAKRIKS